MPVTIKESAKALQTIMSGRKALKVDGKIGPRTMSVYNSLPAPEQMTVRRASRMMGLMDFAPTQTVSIQRVERLAGQIVLETGVPFSYLLKTVELESYMTADKTGYVIDSDGKYQGLGQFDIDTWQAVMPGVALSERTNVLASLRAIARLYLANRKSFVIQGNSQDAYSDSIAYLYHNQGASSAVYYLNTGLLKYPAQSRSAVELFKQARKVYEYQTA